MAIGLLWCNKLAMILCFKDSVGSVVTGFLSWGFLYLI